MAAKEYKGLSIQEKIDQRARQRALHPNDNYLDFLQGNAKKEEPLLTISIEKLHPFASHTFRVDPETADYQALKKSIEEHGIQQPLLVRFHHKIPGEFEIISGHRRHHIAQSLGLEEVKCIAQNIDNDTAIQLMGVSNIQRPDWLPSEKARTYKIHLEATQRKSAIQQGTRTDLTSGNSFPKLDAEEDTPPVNLSQTRNRDEAAKVWGIEGRTFSTYIKLNDLHPALLDIVDHGFITVMAGYHLAFLPQEQQEVVLHMLQDYPQKRITNAKGKELRGAGERGELTEDYLLRLLGLKKDERHTESTVNIQFSSSTLLCRDTVRRALEDANVLLEMEQVLVRYAKAHHLPLE